MKKTYQIMKQSPLFYVITISHTIHRRDFIYQTTTRTKPLHDATFPTTGASQFTQPKPSKLY
jgi:3-polyprenyl-4-hydroxybenzoate decarboxylase